MLDVPMLPAGARIVQVDESADHILRNLLEFYLHDMAEWFQFDQKEDGNYTYRTEELWQNGVDVHFLYIDKIPVGFALVASADEWTGDAGSRDMEEFFIVRRHRRTGLAQAFANQPWQDY